MRVWIRSCPIPSLPSPAPALVFPSPLRSSPHGAHLGLLRCCLCSVLASAVLPLSVCPRKALLFMVEDCSVLQGWGSGGQITIHANTRVGTGFHCTVLVTARCPALNTGIEIGRCILSALASNQPGLKGSAYHVPPDKLLAPSLPPYPYMHTLCYPLPFTLLWGGQACIRCVTAPSDSHSCTMFLWRGGGGSSFTPSPAGARGFPCTVLVTGHLPALATGFHIVRVR